MGEREKMANTNGVIVAPEDLIVNAINDFVQPGRDSIVEVGRDLTLCLECLMEVADRPCCSIECGSHGVG
jgi:hypothetical protein